MLSMRPKGSKLPFYCPARDVMYLFPQVIKQALNQLTQPDLPEVKWLRSKGYSDKDLVQVATAVARYFNDCAKSGKTLQDILDYTKWTHIPLEVRMVFGYEVMTALLAAYYPLVREITPKGGDPPYDVAEIVNAGYAFGDHLRVNRFWRKIIWVFRRLGKVCSKVIGRDNSIDDLPQALPPEAFEEKGKQPHEDI